MGDVKDIRREIEIKLQLNSFTDYLKLLGFLGQAEEEEHHVNAFFDSEDRKLAREGWALRVRAENKRGLVTLKSSPLKPGLAAIRNEIEGEISKGLAQELIALRRDVMSLDHPAVEFIKQKWGDITVMKLVHFTNTRRRKPFKIGDDIYTLELDKTEFSDGSVDYELEVELPDESVIEMVQDKLQKVFNSLGIPFVPQTESKFVRALKKAGMVEQ